MLNRLFFSVTIMMLAAALTFSSAAEAKRLGGGRSIGTQRQVAPQSPSTTSPSQQAPAQNALNNRATPQQPNMPAQSGWRKWAGPLAGLAAGIGLAALFSHMGVGAEFGGILLAIGGALVVFFLLRKLLAGFNRAPSPQPAYAGAPGNVISMPMQQAQATPGAAFNSGQGAFPAGFDVTAFAHQAKVNYIRLQAANDAADLSDIREFTSPEMFAEIKLEIDQRNGVKQRTDVVLLEAEPLEVVEEANRYIASVRFHGSLRESPEAAPQDFDEIWHLGKPVDGSRGWVLVGIQQVN